MTSEEIENENFRFSMKILEESKKGSFAKRDFYEAAIFAKKEAKNNGFFPLHDKHGGFRYSIQQGLMAACHSREDITAISVIQLKLLERLDSIYGLLWTLVLLTGYIAYRLT
jgi:hypothetical protein